jgi:hypothetical protein
MISTDIDIDNYRYSADDPGSPAREASPMDPNIAAWMIAGGPSIERPSERRAREQLRAYLDSRRAAEPQPGPGLLERIARIVRPATTSCTDPACCPA